MSNQYDVLYTWNKQKTNTKTERKKNFNILVELHTFFNEYYWNIEVIFITISWDSLQGKNEPTLK